MIAFWIVATLNHHTFAVKSLSDCNRAFSCVPFNHSSSVDKIYGRGYKSIYNSSITTTNKLFCYGAFACAEAKYIEASGTDCYGSNSCAKALDVKEKSATKDIPHIRAYGASALSYSYISGLFSEIQCYGEQSCAYSTINTHNRISDIAIDAYGAYSLLYTNIDTVNITGTLEIRLFGHYSGFGANITCRPGTNCTIHCTATGCINLHLICDENCVLNIDIASNDNYDIGDILEYNISSLTATNEAACLSQSDGMTFDNKDESYQQDIIINGPSGPICCRALNSCRKTSINYRDTAESVICSGFLACSETNITSNGAVHCTGMRSCDGPNIIRSSGIIYCSGFISCKEADITTTASIYCTGSRSCENSVITINRNDNSFIYFLGYQSGNHANIYCGSLANCFIFCKGKQSCAGAHLVCNGTCDVDCDEDSICPNITTLNPSQNKPPQISDILVLSMATIIFIALLAIAYKCYKKTQMKTETMEQNMKQKVDDLPRNNMIVLEHETKGGALVADNFETGAITPVGLHQKVHKDAVEIQFWLEHMVALPQYFKTFVDSGYEAMSFIKCISNMKELSEIGIESKVHQMRLWEEIKKLKGEEPEYHVSENKKREGSIWNDDVQKRDNGTAESLNKNEYDINTSK
eukprot:145244_1